MDISKASPLVIFILLSLLLASCSNQPRTSNSANAIKSVKSEKDFVFEVLDSRLPFTLELQLDANQAEQNLPLVISVEFLSNMDRKVGSIVFSNEQCNGLFSFTVNASSKNGSVYQYFDNKIVDDESITLSTVHTGFSDGLHSYSIHVDQEHVDMEIAAKVRKIVVHSIQGLQVLIHDKNRDTL